MKELLIKHNFKQSILPNTFTKGKRYKATIWKNGKVIITSYTPKIGRYLGASTYNTVDELRKELEKNHY